MRTIAAIVRYTFTQHLRSRMYLVIGLFGFILLLGALVVSSLATIQRVRLFLDAGLAGIEALALVTAIFTTVHLVLEEMESRSIYLMLAHPLKRSQYIAGRYIGTLGAVGAGVAVMAALHLGGLFLIGWQWDAMYLVAVAFSSSRSWSSARSRYRCRCFQPQRPRRWCLPSLSG